MIKKYETLLKTIDLGSLTRTSEVLGYTQSAISHMISGLEDELGLKILIRDRSGVRLTEEGRRLIPMMRTVCRANQEMLQQVAQMHGLEVGSIRIGTFLSVSVHILPEIIAKFSEKYPSIEFELLQGSYSDIEHWLAEGKIDLGFLRSPISQNWSTIPIVEEHILAVFPESRQITGQNFPLEQIKEESYIMRADSLETELRDLFKRTNFRPKITYSAKDDYAIMAMVAQGLGMSLLPELLLKGSSHRLQVQAIAPPLKRSICLAYKNTDALAPAPRSFLRLVEEQFSQGQN